MVHGKNRIPYWIDWRLTGLAGPEYDATISFRLASEPEDSQYGEYGLNYDSRLNPSREEPDCAPHPFDVMAIHALYQHVP